MWELDLLFYLFFLKQIRMKQSSICFHYELIYTDSKLGLSSWEIFENSLNSFMPLLNTSGGMAYWRARQKTHGSEYAEYINSLIVKQDERPKD